MDAHLTLQGNDLTHAQGMAKYLWSNITPWLQADIGAVVRATGSDELKQSPFLALHISNSRGDKARLGEGGENDYTVRTALLANCDGDTPRERLRHGRTSWGKPHFVRKPVFA